jgi:hypothetical protein
VQRARVVVRPQGVGQDFFGSSKRRNHQLAVSVTVCDFGQRIFELFQGLRGQQFRSPEPGLPERRPAGRR